MSPSKPAPLTHALQLTHHRRWDTWTPKSWTYIPFNGGPRICIGQQFALTEMGYTLVRLLQRFGAIENLMDGVHPGLHADIVLQPAREVRLRFVEGRWGEWGRCKVVCEYLIYNELFNVM